MTILMNLDLWSEARASGACSARLWNWGLSTHCAKLPCRAQCLARQARPGKVWCGYSILWMEGLSRTCSLRHCSSRYFHLSSWSIESPQFLIPKTLYCCYQSRNWCTTRHLGWWLACTLSAQILLERLFRKEMHRCLTNHFLNVQYFHTSSCHLAQWGRLESIQKSVDCILRFQFEYYFSICPWISNCLESLANWVGCNIVEQLTCVFECSRFRKCFQRK